MGFQEHLDQYGVEGLAKNTVKKGEKDD